MNHENMTMRSYNDFFQSVKPRNVNTLQLQRGWQLWYNTLGWYEKTVGSPNTLRDAKSRMVAFHTMNGDSSFGEDTPRDTIRLGSTGPSVSAWQKYLGLAQTGVFDSVLQQATRVYQNTKGLKADGIVGPATWGTVPVQASATSVLSTYKSRLIQAGPIGMASVALLAGGIFAFTLSFVFPPHK